MSTSVVEPVQGVLRAGDVELAFFEWNASRRGRSPTLLLAHATGFHARCWDPMIRHLGTRHVIAVDMRGHGRSEKREIVEWGVFGDDLVAVLDGLDLERVLGVGHSMGGHALVDAAASRLERFCGLVLLDPVIQPPESRREGAWAGPRPGDPPHPTARRRSHFASPRAMFERFEDRSPFSLFDREALWAYCEHGLLPDVEGEGFVLACPPAVEASVYTSSRSNEGIYESVGKVTVPVLVVRAVARSGERDPMDFTGSPTWPGLARAFPDGRDLQLPELSHFLPMEAPARMAALVLEHEAACRSSSAGASQRG